MKVTDSREHRPGTAVQKRSKDTLRTVLVAAFEVLLEEGGAGFSARKVANRAGISLGNLSYYYPTRGDLLHELFRQAVRGYDDRVHQELARIEEPEERLHALAKTWIDAMGDRSNAVPLWELWSISAHEERVADAFEEVYGMFTSTMEEAIADCRPDLPASRVAMLSALAIALIDGGSLFTGAGRKRRRVLGRLQSEIPARIVGLVRDEPSVAAGYSRARA